MNTKQLQAGDFVTNAVRLVRPLAEGGMGRVWVAEHLGLKTQVVVKLMAPEIAARPDGAERFAREAAVAAAVKSPHVVQVFDHGVTQDGTPYIVMELLEGRDLAAHLEEHKRMPPADVASVLGQIGKALSKAHRASIIHRDIKPENIFLCDTEGGELFVKLLDFGTARRGGEGGSRATVPGQIMGTPYYMSPEQSVGGELDAASDIWSLGVVAYEALTGERPFEGSSVGAIALAIHGPLPKMTRVVPELPAALDAWFERACAQEPRERFADAREAGRALVEAVTGVPQVDQPTESLHFPPAPSMAVTMTESAAPVMSLVATLPDPRTERRFTTVAAGVVMAGAAIAMAAIVLGRSPAPTAAPTAMPPATAAVAAAQAAEPTPVRPAEPAPEAPIVFAEPEPIIDAPAPPPPSPKPVQVAATRDVRKAPKPSLRGSRPKPASKEQLLDDDLVRLSTATSKQVESTPEPAPPVIPEK